MKYQNKFDKESFPKKYNDPNFQRYKEPEFQSFDFSEEPECKIFDFDLTKSTFNKIAFLSNFRSVNILDENNIKRTVLMLSLYDKSGNWITAYIKYSPYFLVQCKNNEESTVASYIEKKFDSKEISVKMIEKVDLEALNHLSGRKVNYLKICFNLESDMIKVKYDLFKKWEFAKSKKGQYNGNSDHVLEFIEDIKEYDIPYINRVCIDFNIRIGFWYNIVSNRGFITKIEKEKSILEKPEFSVLAFDLETSKQPLKFPDSKVDCIMLISYVIDNCFYLIVNRDFISKDIQPFIYSPTKDIEGEVTIFNEINELMAIKRFILQIKQSKPLIITTYNGDYFDFPFLNQRCEFHNLNLSIELGLQADRKNEIYTGKYLFTHLDCYYWVKRDAFLPQGSHGLKAVTKAKLGYIPIEVDPEEMVEMGRSNPQHLCEYSVSDAVATYHLYMKHIHDFIFALCTIVPMTADDVLRRGSGALCENLLMAEAYSKQVIFPNKKIEKNEKFYENHLLEAETYVGGYVECINNGAYRADIPTSFKLKNNKIEETIDNVNKIIKFFVEVESNMNFNEVLNLKEISSNIEDQLLMLLESVNNSPNQTIERTPLIYHVDVASMYPNIILTNRLQPTAIVDEKKCSHCLFNDPINRCQRNLGWEWRGSYYPLSTNELISIKASTSNETQYISAIKQFSQKHYKCNTKTVTLYKENTVCMRENSFYVDTIRSFRDLRYSYKELAKNFYKKADIARNEGNHEKANEGNTLGVLYDSLQLAHKIILNSFYGYVMKKGARWYSMEMAGMVTHTGAKIIQASREVLDALGKPLELDTDGIWTLLPQGFPEKFKINLSNGKSIYFNFVCSLLNWTINERFCNDQYQELIINKNKYLTRREMTIFFELDGPYRAMIIPASKEENKKLKKRYVVFNKEGKISEIKGFEIKRRGELGIIKIFQSEIFSQYLKGDSLLSLYQACAEIAKKWIMIIKQKGESLDDNTLIELLAENKVLSKNISEYGTQKGITLTAAKRLAEFLGPEFLNGKGLNCQFIISKKPDKAPLNERVIPVSFFSFESSTRTKLLNNWLKISNSNDETLKSLLDWDYYMDRLKGTLQKLIVIPAILQNIENPLPEIIPPDWLIKKLKNKNNVNNQTTLNVFFNKQPKNINDIESLAREKELENKSGKKRKMSFTNSQKSRKSSIESENVSLNEYDNNTSQSNLPLKLLILKKKWIEIRNKKKQQQIGNIKLKNQEDLQLFGQRVESLVRQSDWRILSILETKEIGVYELLILINDNYQLSKKIIIPRRLFVNSNIKSSESFKLVYKKLPHLKKNIYLYEYSLNEEDFQNKLSSIASYLVDPSIEGVYESKVPLDFRFNVNIGDLCKFDKNKLINKSENINILDLISLETEKYGFFNNGPIFKSNKNVLLINYMKCKFGSFLISLSSKECLILLYSTEKIKKNKDERNQIEKNAMINSIRSMLIKESELENSSIEGISVIELEFNLYNFNKKEDFISKIHFYHNQVTNLSKSSSLLTIVSGNEHSDLLDIWTNIPIIKMKNNFILKESEISPLDWKTQIIDKSLSEIIHLSKIILTIDSLSSYCRIPICSLGKSLFNSLNICLDVLFARELEKCGYIWWANKDGIPDIGTPGISIDQNESLSDCLKCEIINISFCRTFTFEIDISLFYFNALLLSEYFGLQTFEKNSVFDDHVGLRILKDLLMRWYQDLITNEKEEANLLMQNVSLWILSEDSLFFDPTLKNSLDRLVYTAFNQLIKKLEDLGAKIIYANLFKIIIETNKRTISSAESFISYILSSIVKEKNFAFVALSIKQTYRSYLQKDKYNYAGLIINEDKSQELISKWKIVDILPKGSRTYFNQIIQVFMSKHLIFEDLINNENIYDELEIKHKIDKYMENYIIQEFSEQFFELLTFLKENQRIEEIIEFEENAKSTKRKNSGDGFELSTVKRKNSVEFDNISIEMDNFYDDKDSFIQEVSEDEEYNSKNIFFINSPFKKLKTPNTINKKNMPKEWIFEPIIGQTYLPSNISLEFIKIIFSILNFDSDEINLLFDSLKVNSLNFIQVSEFASEVTENQLLLEFSLDEIICLNCRNIKSIDLFMDYNNKEWYCICGSSYSKSEIEIKTISKLNSLFLVLQSQIYNCIYCKQTKMDYFSRNCICGGKYEIRQNETIKYLEKEIKDKFINFKALAHEANLLCLNKYIQDLAILI